MWFLISRTSNLSDDQQPHPAAVRRKIDRTFYTDRRDVDHPDKLPDNTRQEWFANGSNHRVEGSLICRDIPLSADQQTQWMIEIADLESLLKFAGNQPLIVTNGDYIPVPKIEIYDDYRE